MRYNKGFFDYEFYLFKVQVSVEWGRYGVHLTRAWVSS